MAYNYEFPYTDPNRYNDDWLLNRMKDLLVRMDSIEAWKEEYQDAYEAFKKMVSDIEHGKFPDSIRNAFKSWMEKNAINIVGELVKMVYFGLNDDGYFVAYIPEGWDDILFSTTGLDITIAGYDYGHLVLSFKLGGN